MIPFPPLVERALRFQGALFIRPDPGHYEDAASLGYEIGLEQPRKHVRFANVFVYGDATWLYVKHDEARIAELYTKHRGRLMPSEITSKLWSKLKVTPGDDPLAYELLDRSHELIRASLTKQGREALAALERVNNLFPEFHRLAVFHRAAKERVSLEYSDVPETPALWVDGKPVARFARNSLHLKSRKGEGWDVIDADNVGRWASMLIKAPRRGGQP